MSGNKQLKSLYADDENFIRHIVNEMDAVVYVSDPVSHDLLYLNEFGKKTFGIDSYSGKKCYEALHKLSEPCPFCKNEYLILDNFFVWELPAEKNRYLIRDKLIRWDNRLLRMGMANDITRQELVSQRIHRKLQNEQILLMCVQTLGKKDEFSEAAHIILGQLGMHFEADRAYIFEYQSDDNGKMTASNTFEWCSGSTPSMKASFQNMPVDHFSLLNHHIKESSSIIIESIETIKDDHPDDYAILRQQGIGALTIAPLQIDEKICGFIGIDNPKANRNDFSLLYSLALVVANEQKNRKMERKLMELSYTDKLTGLGNRNRYMQSLEQLERTPPPNLGVAFIDLNDLKMVNDQFGHEAGDEYIQKLAGVFRKHFREEDIYRIGGDEFVLLTQRIREPIFNEKIDALRKDAHQMHPDSISLGCVWQEKSIQPADMVKKADQLMYDDKKQFYRQRDRAVMARTESG